MCQSRLRLCFVFDKGACEIKTSKVTHVLISSSSFVAMAIYGVASLCVCGLRLLLIVK